MSRFGHTERTIFVVALLMLVAFSYFLYDDSLLFSRSHNDQMTLIGNVALSQNDVRRKNLDTFSWLPAQKKDQIFENDSIYTGERSEAIIHLAGGGQIRVQPNSLITLNMKNGQMTLDLRYGNLVGDLGSGKSLTIKSGGEEFKLEGQNGNSTIQLKKAHSGNVDLKLLNGGVKYSNSKKSLNLNKETPMAVTSKGDVKPIEKPVLNLESADNIHWTRVNPDDPLPFKWNSKGAVTRFEFELAPTPDFSSIAASQQTTQGGIQVRDPLADGQYFWRVKAIDKEGQVSAVSKPRKMSLTNLGAPQIVTPIEAAVFNLEVTMPSAAQTPKSSAQIQWNSPELLKTFAWQLALDASFSTLVYEGQTAGTSAASPALATGTYWVRVRGLTTDMKSSAWSAPVSFGMNVVAKKIEKPAAPILITKDIEFKIPNGKDRNPASPSSPKLAWKPVKKSLGYKVEIARDPSFRQVREMNVDSTDTMWSQYRPGKFYYRVFAKGEQGVLSDSSEVGTIDIPMVGLVLNPLRTISSVGNEQGPKQAPVSWNQIPDAKSYLVQVDTKQDFSSPNKVEIASNEGNIVLPAPGRYNVRVQARDEENNPISDFSNIQQILYLNRPALTPPKLIEPFNNASIFLQTASEPFIWLEWNKVPGASAYRVEVSTTADFTSLVLSKIVNSNRYLVKDRMPLGKLYWRVRAETKEDLEISDWAKQSEFTLYHQKNETFVK